MEKARVNRVDLASAAVTLVLATATIYAASFPAVDSIAVILFALAWPFVALLWAVSLLVPGLRDTGGPVFGAMTVVLLVLAVVAMVLLSIFGLPLMVVITSLAIAVYALIERRRSWRLGWLISPVLVIVTLALLYTGTARLARIRLAEPQLTVFAEQVARGEILDLPWYSDEGISVAGIPMYEAYAEVNGLHFVTAYAGFLGDVGAGLAYMPEGPPPNGELYQHLSGPWYRWSPY